MKFISKYGEIDVHDFVQSSDMTGTPQVEIITE